jgi:TonB family protein
MQSVRSHDRGDFIMSAQVQHASMASGRSLVFMVIVALHGVAISALMAWRIAETTSRDPDRVLIDWPQQKAREIPEPAAPGSPLQKVAMPIPVTPVAPLPVTDEQVISADPVREVKAVTDTGTAGVADVIADTPLRFQAVRPADDYYPPNSIRLEQQGTVIVRTCVDAAGRLAEAPRVVTGSRFRALDEAAIVWASEALRFTPATKGGTATGACKDFKVNFRLH